MIKDTAVQILCEHFSEGMVRTIVDAIAEHEREECAKIADSYADGLDRNYSEIIADKIRARGQE